MAKQKSSTNSEKQSAPVSETSSTQEAVFEGPTYEQIAQRAYEIYMARGQTQGDEQNDWLQAESELRLGKH
jgi:hypothetical protein